jgi:hypothetical protein
LVIEIHFSFPYQQRPPVKGRRLSQRRPFYIHIRAAAAKSRENQGTSAAGLELLPARERRWLAPVPQRARVELMTSSQPIVIDVTDDDPSPAAAVEDMAGTSVSSSLGDVDPELKWALEASLQPDAQVAPPAVGAAVDASGPADEEKERLFREAVTGAERGELTPVRRYIDAGGSLDRRVTADDATALQLSSSVPKSSLLDVALHRSQTDVVMELLGETERGVPRGASDAAVSTLRRRRLSEDLEDQSIRARLELRGRIRQRGDGLVYVDCTTGSFSMPAGLSAPAAALFGEGQAEDTAISNALSRWNSAMAEHGHALVTLYTPGDLNCLLHAIALSLSGTADRPLTSEVRGFGGGLLPWEAGLEALGPLRCALAASLAGCEPLRAQLGGAGGSVACDQLASVAATDRTSLFREHVSAMASILRRPIIVYAPSDVEVRSPPDVENRMSGVYLPLLWRVEQCEGTGGPIALAYTQGHFSAVVRGAEGRRVNGDRIGAHSAAGTASVDDDGWCEWSQEVGEDMSVSGSVSDCRHTSVGFCGSLV